MALVVAFLAMSARTRGGGDCRFTVLSNTSCGVDTLKTLPTNSTAECCQTCEVTPGCHAFQFKTTSGIDSGNGGSCQLSDRPSSLGHDSTAVCGFQNDDPPGPASVCSVCMQIFPNTTCIGDTLKDTFANTSAECCTLCQTSAGCVAWTWDRNRPNIGKNRSEGDAGGNAVSVSVAIAASVDPNCHLSVDPGSGSEWKPQNGSVCGVSRDIPNAKPTPPPSPAPTSVGGYIGCFVDLKPGAGRDLPYFFCSNSTDPAPMSGASFCADDPRLPTAVVPSPPAELANSNAGAANMSPELCRQLCDRFAYYAVQAGSLCFCGNDYGHFGAAAEAACNSTCTDRSVIYQPCGGVGHNSVYAAPPSPPAAKPQTADLAAARTSTAAPPTSDWVTSGPGFEPVSCIIDNLPPAQQLALPVFFCPLGTQYTPGECTAGTCCSELNAVPGPQCNALWDLDSCNRNQASTTGMSNLTLELCHKLCAGFPYFGLQGGEKCYCGESYARYGNASKQSDCNQPCTGNKKQQCGGAFGRTMVYRRTSVTVYDSPLPPPPSPTPLHRRRHRIRTRNARRHAASPPLSGSPRSNTTVTASSLSSSSQRPGSQQAPRCHGPVCGSPKPSVDWVAAGKVAPPKHQYGCNASWAFAAAAAVESASAIATGTLVPLSEQQLLDCSTQYGAQSCEGGTVRQALLYLAETYACSAGSYPFSASNHRCCSDGACTRAVPGEEGDGDGGIRGYCDVEPGDEDALVAALQHQPVAVGLSVGPAFWGYTGGVLGDCAGFGRLNHAALLVGYGIDAGGTPYWKIKNSMGSGWGEGGYARLSRDGNGTGTQSRGGCGVLAAATYPIVLPYTPFPVKPTKPHHYGPLPCLLGEVKFPVRGLNGSSFFVCTHTCDPDAPSGKQGCPADAGPHVDAEADCLLQDPSTGQGYCALSCENDCDCSPTQACVNGDGINMCVPVPT